MKRFQKNRNFWQTVPRPCVVLAPMANVTDAVFRRLIASFGAPDVSWTEFVSADGLISAGQKKLLVDLEFSPKERPIVAQLFTGHPKAMKAAATLVARLGFDGLDINMGCPDRAVEKQGGGASLIKNPKLALEVIAAAREGVLEVAGEGVLEVAGESVREVAGEGVRDIARESLRGASKGRGQKTKGQTGQEAAQSATITAGIPVSVKTRLGYNKIDLEWIRILLEQNLPALTIHLRTRKEMSDVPAHWEIMPEIIKLRDLIQADMPENERTLIIGNGDVETPPQAHECAAKYGCDGAMIGRGIFGKPWLFAKRLIIEVSPAERLKVLVKHATAFEKAYCGAKRIKSFDVMKKHFKAYVSGWDGAKELRAELMLRHSAEEVRTVVTAYLKRSVDN